MGSSGGGVGGMRELCEEVELVGEKALAENDGWKGVKGMCARRWTTTQFGRSKRDWSTRRISVRGPDGRWMECKMTFSCCESRRGERSFTDVESHLPR